MKLASFAFCSWVFLLLGSTNAVAATSTVSFGVSATVESSCNVNANSFAGHELAASNPTSSISVTCTYATPYNVNVDTVVSGNAIKTSIKLGYAHRIKGNIIDADTSARVGDGTYETPTDDDQNTEVVGYDTNTMIVTVVY